MTLDNSVVIMIVESPCKIRSPLAHSGIPDLIGNNRLDIPSPSSYKSWTFNPLLYFFDVNEILSLKIWLLRSLPGKLTEMQKIFNYRLLRGRRTIGNTFAIPVARWRIAHTPRHASVENV